MRRLKEVEEATALMQEAGANWSVLRWLKEKKRVRKAADNANDALDEFNKEIKGSWSDTLKTAYAELSAPEKNSKSKYSTEIILFVKQVKEADEEAYRARMDAEDTFDAAEKRLSTRMAREGSRKAITSWELHVKAIDKALAGIRASKTVL